MSEQLVTLAARCSACATVFRVVEDQLRVSEGWVRCGRCAEVFNAIDNLVDMAADGLSRQPFEHRGQERSFADPAPAGVTQPVDETVDDSNQRPEAGLLGAPAKHADHAERVEHARYPAAGDRLLVSNGAVTPVPVPAFVVQADRAARWRKPQVRMGMSALLMVALLAMLAQGLLACRHLVAARWPAGRPMLQAMCAATGCELELPRLIDSLAVESSELVRVDGTELYRLSLALRNQSAMVAAAPFVDLTLTDSQGQLLSRRALSLTDLGSKQAMMVPGSELSLQVLIHTAGRVPSGYTVALFYP